MAFANAEDVKSVQKALTEANTALTQAVQQLRSIEDQTVWKGPGRRQYDERSEATVRRVGQVSERLVGAARTLRRAWEKVEEETKLLGEDERRVRDHDRSKPPGAIPGLPRLGADQVLQRLLWDPPRTGDTEWAHMARALYGRSASRVPDR